MNDIQKIYKAYLDKFSDKMAKELADNHEKKGSFAEWEPSDDEIMKEIEHHLDKLYDIISHCSEDTKKEKIPEYCADIANFCAKLSYKYES